MLQSHANDLSVCGKRKSYSKTDVDATFMRMKEDAMKNGQLKPGYTLCFTFLVFPQLSSFWSICFLLPFENYKFGAAASVFLTCNSPVFY